MLTVKNGDILNTNCDIIVHQVNGLGIMGAGLARQIKEKYPNVYQTYRNFTKPHDDPKKLLGINLMLTPNGHIIDTYEKDISITKKPIISNVFGQAYIGTPKKYGGTSKPQTDSFALMQALSHVKHFAQSHNLSVAIPYKIGCGLGGGNWLEIKKLIKRIFHDYPVTLYKL